jgi:hypothetical protein
MRLSDIIGHMNLAFWPTIAMVIFLGVFVSVLVRVYARPRRGFDAIAHLPIVDGVLVTPATAMRHERGVER